MTGVDARATVEAAVRRELFGPAHGETPIGNPVDCSSLVLTFATKEESEGQFHDRDTVEEVLTRSDPLRRYGVGVLYSGGAPTAGQAEELLVIPGVATSDENPDQPPPEKKVRGRQDEVDSDDFDLSDANRRKPSAMAISFKVRVPEGGSLKLLVTGAYYDAIGVTVPDRPPLKWWVRRPFTLEGEVQSSVLLMEKKRSTVSMTPVIAQPKIAPRIQPSVTAFTRSVPNETDPDLRLITLALVNNVAGTGPSSAFFQMGLTAHAQRGLRIEPYPEHRTAR